MLSLRFLALALVLALCTTAQAVVISPTDVALTAGNISTDDDALELSRSFADTLHPVSASAGRTAVELAVIASNTQLASAVCSTGSTAACIAAAVFTVLWNFFAIWRVSNTAPGAIHPARDGLGVLTLVHSQWLPSADCSVACRLHAGAVENSWTLFANSTAAGVTHDLHFIRSGTISGIRATRSTSGGGRDKRQDVDDDGGMVVSYYWDNGNETAYATLQNVMTRFLTILFQLGCLGQFANGLGGKRRKQLYRGKQR